MPEGRLHRRVSHRLQAGRRADFCLLELSALPHSRLTATPMIFSKFSAIIIMIRNEGSLNGLADQLDNIFIWDADILELVNLLHLDLLH
jgi:hypothetical protein